MEQMLGLDAKFLYSETPTAHMHTLKVAIFDMSRVEGGYSYDGVIELLGHRLGRLAPFRRRPISVPLALGHPVWIEDPDFELKRHVTRQRVPAPGSLRELADVVAEVAGRPLRRERPLWELTVVEGLADDRIAIIAKVHHAVADGAATVLLLEKALAPGDDNFEAHQRPEPVPSNRELAHLAARAHAARLRRLPRLASHSVRGVRDMVAVRRAAAVRPPLPFDTPRTPFNVSLTSDRTVAMATVPLEELKEIRRAAGATLNDVFLAMCSGAVRSYLLARDTLPRRPLVASVPVSTGTRGNGGNHVDNLFVSIATDVADPFERLLRIRGGARAAKETRAAYGNDLLEERAEVIPPQLYELAIRTWTRTGLANRLPPPVNLVLSNVAGPSERLRVGGAVLDALYSVGPILEGIGLNMTAWSYAGDLHVTVLGCPASLPDPWRLAGALVGSLEELKRATLEQTNQKATSSQMTGGRQPAPGGAQVGEVAGGMTSSGNAEGHDVSVDD